jgi:hypothetical protein
LENDLKGLFSQVVDELIRSLLPMANWLDVMNFMNFACCLHGISTREVFEITQFKYPWEEYVRNKKDQYHCDEIIDGADRARTTLERAVEARMNEMRLEVLRVLPDHNVIRNNEAALTMLRCLGGACMNAIARTRGSILDEMTRKYGNLKLHSSTVLECSNEGFLLEFCHAVESSKSPDQMINDYIAFCNSRKVWKFSEYNEAAINTLVSKFGNT